MMIIRLVFLVLPVMVMASTEKLEQMVNISRNLGIDETLGSIKSEGGFYFANFLCDAVQVVAQTYLIVCILHRDFRMRIRSKFRQKLFLISLQFIGMSNLMFWVCGSFLAFGVFQRTPWSVLFYGSTAWTVINQFTSPLALFFRFLSMHMIWELYHKCENVSDDQEQGQVTATEVILPNPTFFRRNILHQPGVMVRLLTCLLLLCPCSCQSLFNRFLSRTVRRHV